MSRDLRFRLLVLADGHQPGWVLDVAPDAAPLEDTLRARPARGNAVAVPFRGRLVDLAGSPIAGAVVTPLGFSRRNSQFFGQIEFVDPLAISDSSGAFAFDASDSCTGLTLLVQARTKAPRTIVDLRPQRDSVVVLEDGAMVSGRVLRQGRAAAGIALGLTPVDRGADSFTSPDTIGTNAQGEFLFTNVPAGQDYVLYALSETTAPLALQSSLVTVGDAGTMRRLPDLSLGKGHVLRGRVVMSQGGSVPPGVQVTVMRSLTNQAMRLRPGPSGEFVVEGLPTETVRVNCWLDGYRIGAGSTGQLGDPRRGVRVALQRDTDVVLSLEPSRQK